MVVIVVMMIVAGHPGKIRKIMGMSRGEDSASVV
jgi:hypothetical protein